MTVTNVFIFEGRLSLGYVLFKYTPKVNALDELVQKSVENGFYKFYKDMDYHLKRLHFRSLSNEQDYDDQSQIIRMEHIWLYVYGFIMINCCTCTVFVLEILIFHRKKFIFFDAK